MALKINLKPNEKIFIGGAVLQNGDGHADFVVLNDAPLLREKDILVESEADTLCKNIYLCVQLMYMDTAHMHSYQSNYCRLMDEVLRAAPDSVDILAEINNHLACGKYYQAMKSARKLIEFEKGLLNHA